MRRRIAGWDWVLLLCGWGLAGLASGLHRASAQTLPSKTVAVFGMVVDADGVPVAGAVVTLRGSTAPVAQTRADAAGRFSFSGAAPPFEVSGEVAGRRGRMTVGAGQPAGGLRLVLQTAANVGRDPGRTGQKPEQEMAFSDAPNFTVAGVTDWTAAGGHGSDVILRTSEELARNAAGMNSRDGAPADGASGKRAVPTTASAVEEARLRAAATAQPGSYAAAHALGAFYLRAGRYAAAEAPLEAAAASNHTSGEDEYLLAENCAGLGEDGKALGHVQRALAREDRAEYLRLAGELEERLHHPLAAVEQMQRAVTRDPSEANYFAWGSELLLHRAVAQAAEVFATAAKRFPESARLRSGWGAALYGGGEYDAAATQLCTASDLQPAAREPYVTLGRANIASPRALPCAGERLQRFVERQPLDAEANFYAAMDLLKRGATADSIRATGLLQRAVDLDPRYAPAQLQLGIQAAGRQEYPQAIEFYRKAIAADPQLVEAHYRLGLALERTGRHDEGQAELARRDELERAQAAAVEQQRREIQQFVVETRNAAGRESRP